MSLRVIAWFAVASLALTIPSDARAQDLPDALKGRALSIHIEAFVISPDASKGASAPAADGVSWHQASTGVTVPGTPVGVKLVASNVVILVQVTPFDRDEGHVTLVVQGQVWVRNDSGGLSFRTSIDKVDVGYGETIFFYPLGTAPNGKPSLRVAIAVDKGADSSSSSPATTTGTEKRSK